MLSVEDMCWLLIYYWQPEKMSLDKSLQIHAKAEKLFWTLKGAHIDGYTNKEMKIEKKK